ncbi:MULTISPECIES: AIPR family protein [unclassified Okeania]|uniref:AIPR family protein n=1 Tax=unclassified Okeania TaxID=2634635 RepID=UPI0013B77A74|nr:MULTISPECIES: AIPR family protein [unclassified Okeania]NES77387.1 AIPR family protein [Okeania sp. SIO1H4]NET13550.1 AIPR family protein [Okeania sp. SIO1H6]NET21000.1 AIPR family protein [Okeania sp. SIO1H5]NET94222.1 AIPR family protein [Okeania sp. SIO1H2]
MSNNNDLIIVEQILEDKMNETSSTNSKAEFFEFFSFEQSLKEYDLSDEEISSGLVDGSNDGGIDGFFIFVENVLFNEVPSPEEIKKITKKPRLEVYLIQAKISKSFQEQAIDKFIATIHTIFDLSKDIKNLKNIYNDLLLEKIEIFHQLYKDLASKHPSLKIKYIYASKGDKSNINNNVKSKVETLREQTKKYFSSSQVEFEFLGASELLEISRKEKSYNLELKFVENYISRLDNNSDNNLNKGYVILSKLKDYYEFVTDEQGNLRKYIFESNVRDYQGNNIEVNKDIKNSLDSPHQDIDFWWLNNGVTILASNGTTKGKVISLDDVQIVNGLQTTTIIYEYMKGLNKNNSNEKFGDQNNLDDRAILIKIIFTEDQEARDQIIKATNFQTPIQASSLRATDSIQRNIENYFSKSNLFYDRRKNFYKNMGKDSKKIVTIPYLGQAVTSIVFREPHRATSNPNTIIKADSHYKKVFDESINMKVYLLCAQLVKQVENCISSPEFSEIKNCLQNQSLKKSKTTIKTLKFYIAMLFTIRQLQTATYKVKDVEKLSLPHNSKVFFEVIKKIDAWTDEYLKISSDYPYLNQAIKRQGFTEFLIDKVTSN